MILRAYDKEIECDKVIKGENFIKVYKGEYCVNSFIGISDFSGYEMIEGEFDTTTAEIEALKKNLADTDYIAAKIAEGSATIEEYADIIAQRQQWRARINELQG